jgi:hypothetical protein
MISSRSTSPTEARRPHRRCASIRVKVVVKSVLGVLSTLDGGTVKAGSTWKPSPEVELLLTNVCGVLATDSVSLRLSPVADSNIRIDDVYLDPWRVG